MGVPSSPEGTGSLPTKSSIFTPAGSRPCRLGSTVVLRTKVPERPDRAVPPPEATPDPGVNVERPVAVEAVSSSLSLVGSNVGSFGVGFLVMRWYSALGRFGFM